ncbi:MAG: hypothetical protein RSA86_02195 [Christensenellaceae bacterium]
MKSKKAKTILVGASCAAVMLLLGTVAVAASQHANLDVPINTEANLLTGSMEIDGQPYLYKNGEWLSKDSSDNQSGKDLTVNFWTVDEFTKWMEEQRAENQKLADKEEKSFYVNTENEDGYFRAWTQKDVDKLYGQWEKQLTQMKEGHQFSKPIIDDESGFLAGSFEPNTGLSSVSDSTTLITLPDGSVVNLGSFDNVSEAQRAVSDYLNNQVKLGALSKENAEDILSRATVEGILQGDK